MTALDLTRAAVDVAKTANRTAFDALRQAMRIDLDAANAGDYDPQDEARNIAAIEDAVGILNSTTATLHMARMAYREALLADRRAALDTTKEIA